MGPQPFGALFAMSDLYLPNETYDALVASLAARLPEIDDSQPLMGRPDRAALALADAGIWSMRVHDDLIHMGETVATVMPVTVGVPRVARPNRLNLLMRAARSLRDGQGSKLGAMIALAMMAAPKLPWLEQLSLIVN